MVRIEQSNENEKEFEKDDYKAPIYYQNVTELDIAAEYNEKSDYDDQGNGAIEDNKIMKKAKKFNTKVKNVLNEIEIKVPILIEDNESLKARCNSWKEKVERFKVNKEKYKVKYIFDKKIYIVSKIFFKNNCYEQKD